MAQLPTGISMQSTTYSGAFSVLRKRAFSVLSKRAFSVFTKGSIGLLTGLMALVYLPMLAAEEVAETSEALPEQPPIETIEDALDQPSSPLDSIAESIANTEYDDAQEFLIRFIRAIENAHHRFHPDLARPLTLLGDSHFGKGEFDTALSHYQRAVHINRVNKGLYAPEQIEAVYKESESLQALGDLVGANDREEYAYEVLLKSHGAYSEAMLPGTFHLAEWYRGTYNIFPARGLYQSAIRIFEANGKERTPSAIPALKGLIETYRLERFPPFYLHDGEEVGAFVPLSRSSNRASLYRHQQLSLNSSHKGEQALQHMIGIYRDDPNTDPMIVAEAILELADWHLLFEAFRKAHPLYEHVFSLMTEIESVDEHAYFSEPKMLHFPLPSDPKPPPASMRDEERSGYVEVNYRVSANGSIQDLRTAASEPPGMMDFRVRRSMRAARYRPRMVEGKAVATEGLHFRHEFRYFPRRTLPTGG